MSIPPVVRIGVLVIASTAFYTYVGQMVPQKEVLPPEEIAISADLTTAEMVDIGRQIMEGKGLCRTCHTIGQSGALRFPDLEGIGARAGSRVPGLSDIEYLAESLYEPDAYIVEGFNPGMPAINKPPIGLTDQEILSVIAYLQTLGGTPTVTLQTGHRYLSGAPGVEPADAAPKKGARLMPGTLLPDVTMAVSHEAALRERPSCSSGGKACTGAGEPHTGAAQGAPAKERSAAQGPPRATEPGFGAEPRGIEQ